MIPFIDFLLPHFADSAIGAETELNSKDFEIADRCVSHLDLTWRVQEGILQVTLYDVV